MDRKPKVRRRDDGSVLPLVLVLMVTAGLVVIPLLGYAVAVFRSNTVVSDRTAAVEAAKGGILMALGDPRNVFLTCDGAGDLTAPDPELNKIAVTVSCSEMQEVGPLEALGFEVPIGAVAMQLGAGIPAEFSGSRVQSAPVPPYPVAPAEPDWWLGQESSAATNGKIWMPDLPRLPGTPRTNVPFDMPATFGCKVFFPGRYDQPLSITGNVYFTSGVYYFDEPVTVSGNADVVVGYGLEELPNPDCSDDIQVAANVIGNPGTFDINGGGATWVFGDNGRLVIDDTATTTSLRVRFNQRYADVDRGGRVSIMTVNGGTAPGSDHLVTNVNKVPRSKILNVVDNSPDPDTVVTVPIDGSGYVPSSSTYLGTGLTDEARAPLAPTGFTATPLRYFEGATEWGAILLTWDEVAGQAAGGAFIDRYDVTLSPTPSGTARCLPADLVVTGAPGARQVSCLATKLTLGTNYTLGVVAVNEIGSSASVGGSATPRTSAPISALITAPAAPANVTVVDSNVDDVAQVSWDTPANGGAPITKYVATANRVFLQPQADQLPVAGNMDLVMTPGQTVVTGVPAFDANGDALAFLTVDSTSLPPADGAVSVAGLDVTITTTATATAGTYLLPYTVRDPYGQQVGGTITVVISPTTSNAAPVARAMNIAADVGVPNVSRVPAFDPNGDPLVLMVDTSGLDPLEWTVTVNGLEVAITTTAPDGAYTIPYTVRDTSGVVTGNSIDVTIVRGYENVGTCEVLNASETPLPNACEISLPDLVPGDATSGNVGYRFDVSAVNAVGTSGPGSNPAPLPLAFNGTGGALAPPEARIVEPWEPEAIISMVAGNGDASDVEVAIAGYVAVPMGRLAVTNPDGDDISIKGGVLAGTFDVVDSRAVATVADSLPFGFKNDIVLQRKVRIVATARNITAIAIVQVNEDGAGYSINSWVIQ